MRDCLEYSSGFHEFSLLSTVSHLVLQVVRQVDVLGRVWVIQQLPVAGVHQLNAEL